MFYSQSRKGSLETKQLELLGADSTQSSVFESIQQFKKGVLADTPNSKKQYWELEGAYYKNYKLEKIPITNHIPQSKLHKMKVIRRKSEKKGQEMENNEKLDALMQKNKHVERDKEQLQNLLTNQLFARRTILREYDTSLKNMKKDQKLTILHSASDKLPGIPKSQRKPGLETTVGSFSTEKVMKHLTENKSPRANTNAPESKEPKSRQLLAIVSEFLYLVTLSEKSEPKTFKNVLSPKMSSEVSHDTTSKKFLINVSDRLSLNSSDLSGIKFQPQQTTEKKHRYKHFQGVLSKYFCTRQRNGWEKNFESFRSEYRCRRRRHNKLGNILSI